MIKSETINELAGALAKAQGEFLEPELDRENPFFKSTYATLGSVIRATKAALSKNGLAVSQIVNDSNLETIIMHSSGQYIGSVYPLHPVKTDPQGMGSCISYARRYALKGILGIAEEDNDGNEHTSNQPKNSFTPKQEYKQPENKAVLGPSEAQLKRLHAIASASKWPNDDVKNLLKEKYNLDSSKHLSRIQYDYLCDFIQNNPKNMGDIPH